MVADHPLLSSAGTDNEAQGEVTERMDSRFPLVYYQSHKEKSVKGGHRPQRLPLILFFVGFDNKQGEMASCGISATMV